MYICIYLYTYIYVYIYKFMLVNKKNTEKTMYKISSGVPAKRRQSRQSRKHS